VSEEKEQYEVNMMDQTIINKLEEDLDQSRVKTKKIKGRPDASYLESYDIINTANRIFGYGNWGTKIVDVKEVKADGQSLATAVIELNVHGCLPHQDVGVVAAAQTKDGPLTPQALETALKGAVSDAMKRAFRHFGKQFGNDLYAKDGDVPKSQAPAQVRAPIAEPAKSQRGAHNDAESLKISLVNKAADKKQRTRPSQPQLGLMNGLLGKIFGSGDSGNVARHQFLEYIFARPSSKNLTKGEVSTVIDWAKGDKNPDGSYEPHEIACKEANMVLNTWALEHGQESLFVKIQNF